VEILVTSGLDGNSARPITVRIDERGIADIPIIGEVPLAQMDYVDAEAAAQGALNFTLQPESEDASL